MGFLLIFFFNSNNNMTIKRPIKKSTTILLNKHKLVNVYYNVLVEKLFLIGCYENENNYYYLQTYKA